MGRAAGAHAGGLVERDKVWGQPCLELSLAPGSQPRSAAPCLRWGFFSHHFQKAQAERRICVPRKEAAPHPPMVCFLSGGVEPSETLNDRCYLIYYHSCWKIVWKALTADGELEFQLTPVADRSFQAGNISIISPSRKFCAKLSLQMIKHPGSG